jgi:hypothetical protein
MTISVTRIKKQIDNQNRLNEYPEVSFIERGDEFNVKNKLKIKVSQDNQYFCHHSATLPTLFYILPLLTTLFPHSSVLLFTHF